MKISTGLPLFNTPVDPQGTENQSANAIFHAGSKSLTSHVIDVTETPIIIKAYGFLNDASTITVYTVTTGIGNATYSSPMVLNGHTVQLSKRNNVLVLDMTGKYKFVLSDGLGVTTCVYHESGLPLWSFGLSNFAEFNGMLQFLETRTIDPDVQENVVRNYAKLSQDSGNLLTIHGSESDPTNASAGLYYGPTPYLYGKQYVSSVSGSDTLNTGISPSSPWKTIRQALSKLPDGTTGIIYLKAGETFYTYPETTGDATFGPDVTLGQGAQQIYSHVVDITIGSRNVYFRPYNEPVSDDVNAYNQAHNTSMYPYGTFEGAATPNCPKIRGSVMAPIESAPITSASLFYPIYFQVGINGSITFEGIDVIGGNILNAVAPAFNSGMIVGSGQIIFSGGNITLGNTPILGQIAGGVIMNVTIFGVQIRDHTTPATPQIFASLGTRFITNTVYTASAPGGLAYPGTGLTYTKNGDNAASYLTPKAMWYGIKIRQLPAAEVLSPPPGIPQMAGIYYNLTTDIKIVGAVDP